jgi:hypothetical protein
MPLARRRFVCRNPQRLPQSWTRRRRGTAPVSGLESRRNGQMLGARGPKPQRQDLRSGCRLAVGQQDGATNDCHRVFVERDSLGGLFDRRAGSRCGALLGWWRAGGLTNLRLQRLALLREADAGDRAESEQAGNGDPQQTNSRRDSHASQNVFEPFLEGFVAADRRQGVDWGTLWHELQQRFRVVGRRNAAAGEHPIVTGLLAQKCQAPAGAPGQRLPRNKYDCQLGPESRPMIVTNQMREFVTKDAAPQNRRLSDIRFRQQHRGAHSPTPNHWAADGWRDMQARRRPHTDGMGRLAKRDQKLVVGLWVGLPHHARRSAKRNDQPDHQPDGRRDPYPDCRL